MNVRKGPENLKIGSLKIARGRSQTQVISLIARLDEALVASLTTRFSNFGQQVQIYVQGGAICICGQMSS